MMLRLFKENRGDFMKNCKCNYNNLICFGVFTFFLLNIFTVALPILPIALYYRGLFVIEICLAIIGIIEFQFKLPCMKHVGFTIIIIIFFQLLSYGFDVVLEDFICFDIHRLLAFVLMYMILYECAKFGKISLCFYENFNTIILLFGLFACLYNIVINRESILTFNLSKIMYFTSMYKSFFLTRSNFCLLLTTCYTISIHRWEKEKKIVVLALAIFFAVNILLTNARTSILTISVVTILFLTYQKKSNIRNIMLFLVICLVLVTLPWDSFLLKLNDLSQKYSLIFRTGSSDVSNGRFTLWKLVFDNINPVNLLIGHGIGSKDAYLSYIGEFATSFHSSWIDLFYEGGVTFIIIYAFVFYNVIQHVKYSHLSQPDKRLLYSYIVIVLLCGGGDAIALPFMLDTSTIFSTIMFITIPLTVANGSLKENSIYEKNNGAQTIYLQ